jgi:predicted permease
MNSVSLGHFTNMGMRILGGRDFQSSDNAGKPRPSIVSASFARQFFPGSDPIGRTFGTGGPGQVTQPEYQIVGVVNDTKYRSMRENPPPTFYLLFDNNDVKYSDGLALHVRVRGEPATVIHELREMLSGVGPGLAPTDVATMEQEIETSLWQERLLSALSSVFGALSALLAGIGLFGMLAFAVSRRTCEIGIRMAVGATVKRIVTLIAQDAAWTVLPGIVLGLAAYAACSRLLASLLYGVSPWDTVSLAGATMFLIGVAVAAAALPSLRAARVEPLEALREE